MRFPVKIPITKTFTEQKVVNKAWADSGTVSGDLQPLLTKVTNANDTGLPFKSSHQFFTNSVVDFNTRFIDENGDIYLVVDPKFWGNHTQAILARVIMDDVVSVTGTRVTGTKADGSPKTETLPIYDSIHCTLIPFNGDIIVATSGAATVVYMDMYCDIGNIKVNDIITDLSTGSKYKVLNVKQFNTICYQKIRIQGVT